MPTGDIFSTHDIRDATSGALWSVLKLLLPSDIESPPFFGPIQTLLLMSFVHINFGTIQELSKQLLGLLMFVEQPHMHGISMLFETVLTT
jgi:hypothetical protein